MQGSRFQHPLIEEVERVIVEFKYWPSKADFVREAVLEKRKRVKKTEGPRVA